MLIEIQNTITNDIFEVCIVLKDFTTFNLYEAIVDQLDVPITNVKMLYNNKEIEISEYILCEDIFNNNEYAKIQLFPNMKTDTLHNKDEECYSYISLMEYSKRMRQVNPEKIIKKMNRLHRKMKLKQIREDVQFVSWESSINNIDLDKDENKVTKSKMDTILSKIHEKKELKINTIDNKE